MSSTATGVTNRIFSLAARAVHHDFRSAKFISPMQQVNTAGEFGKKIRLFHRRIAAADHRDFLPAEEIPVAGRARRDAISDQLALGLQSDHARRSARRHNKCAGFKCFRRRLKS